MRFLSFPTLACAVLAASLTTVTVAQDDNAPVATLQMADGTSVALLDWKVSYEFISWKQKEPVTSAKPQRTEIQSLVLGKKTYPLKGDSLALKHLEADETARVISMSLNKSADLKIEQPSRELVAPSLEKNMIYQPRSMDISGKTLSGMGRSFCVASFSPLLECGLTKSTRVVKIDFN